MHSDIYYHCWPVHLLMDQADDITIHWNLYLLVLHLKDRKLILWNTGWQPLCSGYDGLLNQVGGRMCHSWSETLAKVLVDYVTCRHGVPKELLSDRGANLLSNLMIDICKLTGMKKINTTAYHPQTDGFVENFNCMLRAILATQQNLRHGLG